MRQPSLILPIRCVSEELYGLAVVQTGFFLFCKRNYHRHRFTIVYISLAKKCLQILFLKLNRYQDVGRRDYGKKQLCDGHGWCEPEGKEPSKVQRVANQFIGPRRSKGKMGVFSILKIQPNLPQAEQIEMVDSKCGDQYQRPAETEQSVEYSDSSGIGDFPDGSSQRLPVNKQQYQCSRGEQDIRTSFNGLWN